VAVVGVVVAIVVVGVVVVVGGCVSEELECSLSDSSNLKDLSVCRKSLKAIGQFQCLIMMLISLGVMG